MIPLAQPVRLRRLDPSVRRTEQIGLQQPVGEVDILQIALQDFILQPFW